MMRGQSSPIYAGEIASAGDWRLIVLPRGTAYVVQQLRDGVWTAVRRFEDAGALRSWLATGTADLPQELATAAAQLADDPRDCVAALLPAGDRRGISFAFPAGMLARLPDGRRAVRVAACQGVSRELFLRRLELGWSVERAVFEPVPRWRAPVERPSLLRELRLADGRLAWPVACELGVSEATFRSRLARGLSPDEATFAPVSRRSRRGWAPAAPRGPRGGYLA